MCFSMMKREKKHSLRLGGLTMDLGRRPRSSYLDCLGFPENERPELYTHGGRRGRGGAWTLPRLESSTLNPQLQAAMWSPPEADKFLTQAGLAAAGLCPRALGPGSLGHHFLPAWQCRTKSHYLPPVVGLRSVIGLLVTTLGLCRPFATPEPLGQA